VQNGSVPFLEESLGSMLEAAFSHPQQPDMALSVAQDPFVRESSAGTAALRRAVSHSAWGKEIHRALFGPPTAEELDGMYPSSRLDPIWEEWEEYGCKDEEENDSDWGGLRGGRILSERPEGSTIWEEQLVQVDSVMQWKD